jgi:hypothetical protein
MADARQGWNDLVDFWPILAISAQSVAYLSGMAGERLNYVAGDDAILPLDPSRRSANYNIEGPDPKQNVRLAVPATAESLVVPGNQALGQWHVTGKTADGKDVVLGYSVNPSEGEEVIVPLEEKELFGIFGSKDGVKLAQDAASLERQIKDVRVGFEIFPWLMMLILVLVTLENLLANKFHRERPAVAVA